MDEALVVCVRGVMSFFSLLIFTRVLGKQQMGQITFFDYIIGITIGSFAASLTVDLSTAAWPHWIAILTWVVLGVLLQKISLKHLKISQYINDVPTIIIHNGKIIGENLKNTKFTFAELLEELRYKCIFDIKRIKFGIIEANGKLSVIENDHFHEIVDGFIAKAEAEYEAEYETKTIDGDRNLIEEVIFNGIIIDDNLLKLKLSRKWLFEQLEVLGYSCAIEIFYAYIDSLGKLKVEAYSDIIISSKNIFKP